MSHAWLIWAIALLSIVGVILRPMRVPEAVPAMLGAALVVALGLLPWRRAGLAVLGGMDVYLFLTGMMLLSEAARREGVFDWLAGVALRRAAGSPMRLFALVYGVGTVVTVLLSNDATAVVLTPAVAAAARAARAEKLPYLLACAFVANAASFVLPISNPANLVFYDGALPRLGEWLARFALPSALAIAATGLGLAWLERRNLVAALETPEAVGGLSGAGRVALLGIAGTVLVLLAASAFGVPLGLPTALAGTATAALVLIRARQAPWALLGGVAWSVLPLVAGLFVLVAAVDSTGLVSLLAGRLAAWAPHGEGLRWGGGFGLAVLCNLVNNLPAGLLASHVVAAAHPAAPVTAALLIGVDLGPNLSVTGSLATILWLLALRREGVSVSFGYFLARGAVLMPVALALALAVG